MRHPTPLPQLCAAAALLLMQAAAQADAPQGAHKTLVDHGRYLVKIAGCNDCHTPGYMQAAGKVDEKLWLTGDSFGWRGPWGTTYATNLRLYAQNLTPQQWVQQMRTMQPRPPMPFFNVQAMSERDLKAIHAYLKALAGRPAGAGLGAAGQGAAAAYALFPG